MFCFAKLTRHREIAELQYITKYRTRQEKMQEKTKVQQFNTPMFNTILKSRKLATVYKFHQKNKLNNISILSIGVLKSVLP